MIFQLYELDTRCLFPSQLLGPQQIAAFAARYCRAATSDEVKAAGYDPLDIDDGDSYLCLDTSPRHDVQIPGFTQYYKIHMQWRRGQIIHPSWLSGN